MGMADHHSLESLPGSGDSISNLLDVAMKHENVKENGFRLSGDQVRIRPRAWFA
jgi:hypothetical protein